MTKKETVIMLGYLKIAYPNLIKDNDPELLLSLWYEMLCDEESTLVRLALKKHITNSKYLSSIAEFLNLIESIKWTIYLQSTFTTLVDNDTPKKILACYLLLSITHHLKQFEINGNNQIAEIIKIETMQTDNGNLEQLNNIKRAKKFYS